MPSTLSISTSQIYTLIYLYAHLCYAASMVFFFSRTLSPRFFVRKPFLYSLPFLGILLLYTGITGDAQSPFFKIVFYGISLAANGMLYGTRFWRRIGNYFFIVICLGIAEFIMSLLYYPLLFLFQQELRPVSDPVVPKENPVDLLVFITLPIVLQILFMPFFIRLWQKAVQHINLKILIQLVLSMSLSGSGVLYVFPQLMGKTGWILVFLGTFFSILLLFRGIRQIRLLSHLHRTEQEIIKENLESYNVVRDRNLRLRRQNHDNAGHLQTVSYLLTEGKTTEAQKYIHDLLKLL